MLTRLNVLRTLFVGALAAFCAVSAPAQNVKRVVIVKIDGLPGYYVDQFVKQRDPETGKSLLPWFEEVFYKNGTRVPNFYTRGMSISGPSWGQLDTGQHLQVKGNVEYDRYTLHAYDYLNFIPYYVQYGLKNKADMPAVEVMDQLGIPLLADAFQYENRYTSQQLYQRGNNWEVLASGVVNLYPGDLGDFIDEWTIGLDYRKITINQAERDIIGKLVKRPDIDYFDYYDVSFDHVSHSNNDTASRLASLKELDRTIGKMWVAIQGSSRVDETALILISDHGFNSEEKTYSQGFNLVRLLGSAAGGAHHVITKRRLMLDYSIKGLYPFTPLYRTDSKQSYYLKHQTTSYVTALLDFDGNERSSVHLRNSDLNTLHILLQQLQQGKLSPELQAAVANSFFEMVDRHRGTWQRDLDQLMEELDALRRWRELQKKVIDNLPKKLGIEDKDKGYDKQVRRVAALAAIAETAERDYRKYAATLKNLLGLRRESFNPRKLKVEEFIAVGAMGDPNSIYQLQNYVADLSPAGLSLDKAKNLALDKSFRRVNYLDLLHEQKVRNNVQPKVGGRPIDFVAVRVPGQAVSAGLPAELYTNEDAIWLVGAAGKQALILSRTEQNGGQSHFYLPVADLRQTADGKVSFQVVEWSDGFPLKYFEDKNFAISPSARSAWLGQWHSEIEWMNAVHKTEYSNAIIGLREQLSRKPIFDREDGEISDDERLVRRFRRRQRDLTDPELLILANNHWNFDVRGFNPGGNHGSFFRVSTNSTFMIAGGAKTGVPRGLAIDGPYDSLSFMPTVLRLMGKIDDRNQPVPELRARGFRKFPGRVIHEITNAGSLSPVGK